MDFSGDLNRLHGAVEALEEHWPRQRNEWDNETDFILCIYSYNELVACDRMKNLSNEKRQYALHRWYNKITSEVCEKIFVEYGARKASDEENIQRHIDVFIHEIPFDIKLSVFPRSYSVRRLHLDLKRRNDKDELIKWLYANQSSERRNCFNNRIFLVCEGNDTMDNNRLKQSFDQMEVKIKTYMEYLRLMNYSFNEVRVQSSDNIEQSVKADIITLTSSSDDLKERLMTEVCPQCNSKYRLMVARMEAYKGNMIMKCKNCYNYINV